MKVSDYRAMDLRLDKVHCPICSKHLTLKESLFHCVKDTVMIFPDYNDPSKIKSIQISKSNIFDFFSVFVHLTKNEVRIPINDFRVIGWGPPFLKGKENIDGIEIGPGTLDFIQRLKLL